METIPTCKTHKRSRSRKLSQITIDLPPKKPNFIYPKTLSREGKTHVRAEERRPSPTRKR